jgi:hypothetical protein
VKVSVYYCFPRSGGTLLNQCLLCHDQNIVLSEVNPSGSVIHPAQQARVWFNLSPVTDSIDQLLKAPYCDVIYKLAETSAVLGRKLCLRDWIGPNFLPRLSPWVEQPSLQLEQKLYLQFSDFECHEIVFLRRSRAVFASLRKNIPECAELSIKQFETAYRPFLEQTQSMRRFFFEDFVQDSAIQLNSICECLDLAFAPDFSTRFAGQNRLTGNNTLPSPTKSATWNEIKIPVITHEAGPNLSVFRDLDLLAGYAD